MKYSEAIRLGGMMRPKIKCVFSNGDGVCVQGAALDACGSLSHRNFVENIINMKHLFPEVHQYIIERGDVPITYLKRDSLYNIQHVSQLLNDCTDWTRERIADWVEKMEIKYNVYNDQPITTEVQHEDTIDVLTPVN